MRKLIIFTILIPTFIVALNNNFLYSYYYSLQNKSTSYTFYDQLDFMQMPSQFGKLTNIVLTKINSSLKNSFFAGTAYKKNNSTIIYFNNLSFNKAINNDKEGFTTENNSSADTSSQTFGVGLNYKNTGILYFLSLNNTERNSENSSSSSYNLMADNQKRYIHKITTGFKINNSIKIETGIEYKKLDATYKSSNNSTSFDSGNISKTYSYLNQISSLSETALMHNIDNLPFTDFTFSIAPKIKLHKKWELLTDISFNGLRKYASKSYNTQQSITTYYYTTGTNKGKPSSYYFKDSNYSMKLDNYYNLTVQTKLKYAFHKKKLNIGIMPEIRFNFKYVKIDSTKTEISISKYDSNNNGYFETTERYSSENTSAYILKYAQYNYDIILNIGLNYKLSNNLELRAGANWGIDISSTGDETKNYQNNNVTLSSYSLYQNNNLFIGADFHLGNTFILEIYTKYDNSTLNIFNIYEIQASYLF